MSKDAPRVDLVTTIHKAVRKVLFEHALLLDRTDFREPDECRRVQAETSSLLTMLGEHARHEDRVIFPAVATHDPAVAAEAASQHEILDAGMATLERLAGLVAIVTASERTETGSKLRAAFAELLIQEVVHWTFEETHVNRVLWDHHTDGELEALRERVRSSMTPARHAEWRRLLLASVNASERAHLG